MTVKSRLARAQASAGTLRGQSSVLGQPTDGNYARDMISDPNRIADVIASGVTSSLPGFIFPETLAPSGVAVYTQSTAEDLKVEGIGDRAEHGEYPMVRFTPGDLKEARTGDIGGKFRVSDEALAAGDGSLLNDGMALLATSIRRVLNQMLVEALDLITQPDGPGQSLATGNSWRNFTLTGQTPTPELERPWADIIAARRLLSNNGLAANADAVLVDETSVDALSVIHGPGKVSEEWGMAVYSSPELPDANAFVISSTGFGNLVTKNGLQVETWRDPSIRATWVQAFIEPTIVIHRPANVVRIVGIDGIQAGG